MSYFLGVDIGTTSVKAVAFNAAGQAIAVVSAAYKMFHPMPGWSEQDPDEILEAVTASVNKVVAAQGIPAVISFSAAMHSVLAVNEAGKPLTACIIWADNRAADIAEGLRASAAGEAFYHATGAPVHAMLPLCKIAWLKENSPGIFQSTYKFIGIKEYILFHMLGEYVVDTSIASATGLLNIHHLQWDERILQWLGITTARLPEVVVPVHMIAYKGLYTALSLPAGVPFVIGGSDGALANLGAGAMGQDTMAISIGTSSAARMVVERPVTDARMRTFCYHLKDSYYIMGGASNNGAVVLQWLKESILETGESYEELFALAESIAPGADGLLFIPYILGERAPVWNSRAKGVCFGLGINHTKAHLVRATIEGMICCVYSFGKILLENRDIRSLHVTGGFAGSKLGLQVLADMFNRPVLVRDAVEGSALGAAMIGMEALGMPQQVSHRLIATYRPDVARHDVYSRQMKKFERLYEAVKNEFLSTH